MRQFPLAKLGALVALVGLTLLTFVSCEGEPQPNGVDGDAQAATWGIKGHEFMIGTWNESRHPDSANPEPPEVGPLYADDHQWLQWLYWALLGLAVVAFVIPRGQQILVVVGLLGVAGVAFFIHRFNVMFARDNELQAFAFDWDIGAVAAVVGFTLAIIDGMDLWGTKRPVRATEVPPESTQEPA